MQKSLSFSKGITTAPSDLLSDDTELAESLGLIFRDGEMHPIQSAKCIGWLQDPIVYVHKMAGQPTHVITCGERLAMHRYGGDGFEKTDEFAIESRPKSIAHVGNTLVVGTSAGPHYFRYADGRYTDLGTGMPKPEVKFWMGASSLNETDSAYKNEQPTLADYIKHDTCKAYYSSERKLLSVEEIYGISDAGGISKRTTRVADGTADDTRTLSYVGYGVKPDRQNDFDTAVQGCVAHEMAMAKKNKAFAFPFFVRFALRLYDGSYARISNPVLCLPSIRNNGALFARGTSEGWATFLPNTQTAGYFDPRLHKAALYFKCSIPNAAQWNDIVKDFVVFASDEVLPFAIDGGWQFMQPSGMMKNTILDYIRYGQFFSTRQTWTFRSADGSIWGTDKTTVTYGPLTSVITAKKMKTDRQICDELLAKTVFYKLFEAKVGSEWTDGEEHNSQTLIKDSVVETLAEQEQLGTDDYYGWTTMTCERMLAYNSRINLIGVQRYPFSGFGQFVAAYNANDGNASYDCYTRISSPSMSAWVAAAVDRTIPEAAAAWLYYPDTNAKEIIVAEAGTANATVIGLQQHPRLNGAYHLALPDGDKPGMGEVTLPEADTQAHESLTSQILTSVVNNPFVFEASGDNVVGTGKVIGMAANTEPVSQGQFGQYPLIVFTTEGIYGMAVSGEGLYSASYPISREVCSEADTITPTGSTVFFASKKGLMCVAGSKVTCVSEQLRGAGTSSFASEGDTSFAKFLEHALLAYDYPDSLLHILGKEDGMEYVYSMRDGTFGKKVLHDTVRNVANDYPDCLYQAESGDVFSLMGKPDACHDTETYDGTLVTRPLKLGSSLQLKTIHRMVHLLHSEKGTVSIRLYGSNDCRNWCPLKSLHGKPWKYYTISYKISGLRAADTFAGSVIDFQTLLPDKIR